MPEFIFLPEIFSTINTAAFYYLALLPFIHMYVCVRARCDDWSRKGTPSFWYPSRRSWSLLLQFIDVTAVQRYWPWTFARLHLAGVRAGRARYRNWLTVSTAGEYSVGVNKRQFWNGKVSFLGSEDDERAPQSRYYVIAQVVTPIVCLLMKARTAWLCARHLPFYWQLITDMFYQKSTRDAGVHVLCTSWYNFLRPNDVGINSGRVLPYYYWR